MTQIYNCSTHTLKHAVLTLEEQVEIENQARLIVAKCNELTTLGDRYTFDFGITVERCQTWWYLREDCTNYLFRMDDNVVKSKRRECTFNKELGSVAWWLNRLLLK